MDADEREIYYFLKQYRTEFLSAREICRRAGGKRRFRQEESWALAPLLRMKQRDILETDSSGAYRIKPKDDKKLKRWVAPEIARVLRSGKKEFEEIIEIDEKELDEYYENL